MGTRQKKVGRPWRPTGNVVALNALKKRRLIARRKTMRRLGRLRSACGGLAHFVQEAGRPLDLGNDDSRHSLFPSLFQISYLPIDARAIPGPPGRRIAHAWDWLCYHPRVRR